MATKVLIIGNSGTGKSTAIRTLPPDQTQIIRVVNKNLPFREAGFQIKDSDSYKTIKDFLVQCEHPIIVIDDVQYLLANEFMRRATEKGYEKFTELAKNFWELLNTIDKLTNNKTVYLLSHLESDDKSGFEKFKTIGKLLDEKITIEGLFTIVLKSGVEAGAKENRYVFYTQNNGKDTVKSPMGLFDFVIDNDLGIIDKRIREFYGIELEKPPYSAETDEFIRQIRIASTKDALREIGVKIKESTLPLEQKAIIRNIYQDKFNNAT